MRRARIKAIASVPVRRKVVDKSTIDANVSNENANVAAENNKIITTNDDVVTDVKTERNPVVPIENVPDKHVVDLKKDIVEEKPVTVAEQLVSTEEVQAKPVTVTEQLISTEEVQAIIVPLVEVIERPIAPPEPEKLVVDSPKTPSKELEKVPKSTPTLVTNETPSPLKSTSSRVSFMRPTPRLDGPGRIRRNSVQGSGASASESEDETRRSASSTVTKQAKNDIVEINQADKQKLNNNNVSDSTNVSCQTLKKRKRKICISDQARKLAEAKREFARKHDDKNPPDRTKLTMYDLIYYNPSTNPMKKVAEIDIDKDSKAENEIVHEKDNEHEDVDDPESSAMPVPQVKVGPNGELLIDEQSLVIHNSDVEKQRELLSQKKALVDEAGRTGGFYKRKKKSKDWSKIDTIKFYKALSTVGTDFLLMQSLFPDRSRHNIKMKYKKEERIHKVLIEKALSCPRAYDVEQLKQEFKSFEEEEEEEEEEQKEDEPKKSVKARKNEKISKTKLKKKKYKSVVQSSIPEIGNDDNEKDDDPCPIKIKKSKLSIRQSKYKRNQISKNSEIDSDEDDDYKIRKKIINNDKEIEENDNFEVYKAKPTRSGRLPNAQKILKECRNTLDEIFGEDDDNVITVPARDIIDDTGDELVSENGKRNIISIASIEKTVPGIQNVEPGSLVICSKECSKEPGKTLFQVYMVSSDTKGAEVMTPVELSSELLSTVTNGLETIPPLNTLS